VSSGIAAWAALVAVAALAGAGCSPPAEPPDQAPKVGRGLDTVDVTAPPDAAASLEGDRHEPAVGLGRERGGIAGALPEGFPKDVPLPQPSSLVDFDARSVTLEVAGQLEGVRTSYVRQLAGAGYAARDGGRWQRGARMLRVAFAPVRNATRVTVEIVPAS
jgi:hypothetical protein